MTRGLYRFDKLLIATGRPTPSIGEWRRKSDPLSFVPMTFSVYVTWRARADRFVIIGRGFIGSELAASLTSDAGNRSRWSRTGRGIGATVFPSALVELPERLLPRTRRRVDRASDTPGLEETADGRFRSRLPMGHEQNMI